MDESGLQKTGDRGGLDVAVNLEKDDAEDVGEEGMIVRCDELSQMQGQKYGSKKTDYDVNPRLLHLSESAPL